MFKKKYGLNKKIVLFLGRFNPTKGPEKLALVAKEIVKEREDIAFIFLGPDEGKKDEVKSIVKGSPRVHILEPLRDKNKIAEAYQSADVYALPSYREGLPLTLFEALAAGIPIVASPVNGVPYEMKDPDNGYFVDYGDLDGLKLAILKVLDNKTIADNMKKNNIMKAKNYDWDLISNTTEHLYKSSLSV